MSKKNRKKHHHLNSIGRERGEDEYHIDGTHHHVVFKNRETGEEIYLTKGDHTEEIYKLLASNKWDIVERD